MNYSIFEKIYTMKSILFLTFLSLATLGYSQSDVTHLDSVETFKQWDDLFCYQNYYISGQPDQEKLE